MNSPTRFQEPGCPLPHAVRLPSWDSGRCTPASGGRAEEAAPETAVGAGLARRPEAGGRRSPPPGLGGEDTPAQEPRRGAAIRVGGSFSSGRSGHLGAARGLILPGGRCWGGAAGPGIPQDLGTPWTEVWPRHPARFCSIEAENRCVSESSPPQLLSAGIQPPSCRHRRAPAPEGGGVCAGA